MKDSIQLDVINSILLLDQGTLMDLVSDVLVYTNEKMTRRYAKRSVATNIGIDEKTGKGYQIQGKR